MRTLCSSLFSFVLDFYRFHFTILSIMSVSLENFDPHTTSNKPLDSPRSIEACRRAGIEQEELLYKPIEYYREELGETVD